VIVIVIVIVDIVKGVITREGRTSSPATSVTAESWSGGELALIDISIYILIDISIDMWMTVIAIMSVITIFYGIGIS